MTSLKINVDIANSFQKAVAKVSQIRNYLLDLSKPTQEALDLLKERMQRYPAPPPNSKYKRTYELKNSWQTTVILSGATLGKLTTNIPYAPYVVDEEDQAGIHQGRWQTIQQVAQEEDVNITAIYERELERVINL